MSQAHRGALFAVLTSASVVLTACSGGGTTENPAASGGENPADTVTITNCGEEVSFPAQAAGLANDGNLIALNLALDAQDQLVAVSSMNRDRDVLVKKYGEKVNDLKEISEEYPSLEQIVAESPQVFYGGWGYGLGEDKNITPDSLAEHDISTYILTEACRQEGSTARGVENPWDAVRSDLRNVGAITGHEDTAAEVIADMDDRIDALTSAPQAEDKPVVFLYDSGTDAVFTSGAKGAPAEMVAAAGGDYATDDLDDTWVEVGWEKLADAQPDVFVFVDYPGQSFEQKVEQLKNNPATKDLEAVKQERFINLPYAVWTSGPLNIDGAELVRKGLEDYGLVPESDIKPSLDVQLNH
ncbi:corrinoid ABC transporter substrate-binding protein [Corynebacterium ciconiae DSM 44920]|uniref:ABC transporter substrate-binding protein n=1 Tax=Corynebacterium ciconiae TaxID=227319 RepID=UPI00035C3014|nr:ABC transporter substrate-binding protein [Corynebacterium ciconiae]WKD61064.1 corrinoid ABC transporter substrate-binding protein [Corynebacterium ciconiae DSM 44920]